MVSGSDSRAAIGEQRRPTFDHVAQATIDERLGDQRPRDIACEARHLGHLSVGQLSITAFGRSQNRLPHRGCNKTGLTRAVRGLEPPVDREQNLPGLDLVGNRSAEGPVGRCDRVDLLRRQPFDAFGKPPDIHALPIGGA